VDGAPPKLIFQTESRGHQQWRGVIDAQFIGAFNVFSPVAFIERSGKAVGYIPLIAQVFLNYGLWREFRLFAVLAGMG